MTKDIKALQKKARNHKFDTSTYVVLRPLKKSMECPLCEGTGEVRRGAEAIPATVTGKLLKDARERKHLSLREVERITGLSNALLSQVENGRIKNASFHSVVSLCSLYGVKIETLITRSKGQK